MLEKVKQTIQPLQEKLLRHDLYAVIQTPEDLVSFMEHHVYAVWDFMSLLKALQNGLTCTTLPWKPLGNPETRYLINEIVLAEETDINAKGQRQSHFEMYLDAMEKAGADVSQITAFIERDFSLKYVEQSLAGLPAAVAQFLAFTFEVIKRGKLHEIAAVFTFGREDLIPSMFTAIIGEIETHFPENDLADFKYYFDRHIELDEEEHGPMALEMVKQLCDNDLTKWNEVITVSQQALEVRLRLWDGIKANILSREVVA